MKIIRRFYIVLLLVVLSVGGFATQAQSGGWWLLNQSVKVTYPLLIPATPSQTVQLHAARGEVVAFQVVFGDVTQYAVPQLIDASNTLQFTLYEQVFVPITVQQAFPSVYTPARLTDVTAIADGLIPITDANARFQGNAQAIWVDVAVPDTAQPGIYTVTINLLGTASTIEVIVYDVTLPEQTSMDIIIPLSVDWTLPFFANGNVQDFHTGVNNLMLEHSISSGHLAARPFKTDAGWDFSAFDVAFAQMPAGMDFLTPIPFNEVSGTYFVTTPDGFQYTTTDFDDPEFVAAISEFFVDLADYLTQNGRIADAWVYPSDETFWVADEPEHNGPEGYQHLAQWTEIIRAAGLKVLASRVTPAPFAPNWDDPASVTDNVHVPVDMFDAAPSLYDAWGVDNSSWYLNEYGDAIELPASIHRGLLWHAYQQDVRLLMGYAGLEWVDETYDLVNPLTQLDRVYPQYGYGGGALIWSDTVPSTRLKFLRSGLQDAQLLDLYAEQQGQAAVDALLQRVIPISFTNLVPPDDLWVNVHDRLLQALNWNRPIELSDVLLPLPLFGSETYYSFRSGIQSWDLTSNASRTRNPRALQVTFGNGENSIGHWSDGDDLSAWDYLQIPITNQSPYYAQIDVALIDDASNYVLLRGTNNFIAPNGSTTLLLPLVVPIDYPSEFNWSAVTYLEMTVSTEIALDDYLGNERITQLGTITLVINDLMLVR